MTILQQLSQHYADAKSYYMEIERERWYTQELSRSWQKEVVTAAEAPGHRYRFEGSNMAGTAVLASDGKTEWAFLKYGAQYTQKPVSESAPKPKARMISPEEYAATEAKNLRSTLAKMSGRLKSATRLRDETIRQDGKKIRCYVVRIETKDLKTTAPGGNKVEHRFWIDQRHNILVKDVQHDDTFVDLSIPLKVDTTTVYKVTRLDQPIADEVFVFHPPVSAKLVEEFADPMKHMRTAGGESLLRKAAPQFEIKLPDGSKLTPASVKGKALLLEFWATWCAPCIDGIPATKKLYSEIHDKGLEMVSIDIDEDAKSPAKLVEQEKIPWPNFHDEDGKLRDVFHANGVPLWVLIDREGKVVFWGFEESDVRKAIAKLGTEFASVAAGEQGRE